jgi:hypothetical protein
VHTPSKNLVQVSWIQAYIACAGLKWRFDNGE